MARVRSICFLLAFCYGWSAHGQTRDSMAVMHATQTFLKAFQEFDWPTFRNSFARDATMFHPEWPQAKRSTGQKEIEATWLEVFPEFTDSTKNLKLDIAPKDIRLQLYGKTALVTFHLGSGATRLSRRTFVFVKQKRQWKIVHLHASNLASEWDQ